MSIDWGTLTPTQAQTLASFAAGATSVLVTAWANRYHWAPGMKYVVALGVCVVISCLQLAMQGELHGLPVLNAVATSFLAGQALYASQYIKGKAADIEKNFNAGPTRGD